MRKSTMNKSHNRPKSTAMVVTVIALSFALADSAVAELSTAKVKKIARSVATQEINKRAPGLSVGSAVSAQSANTANSANPVLFARVNADGTVDPANSKGISSENVIVPQAGTPPAPIGGLYCFSGLPAIKGGQITPEIVDLSVGSDFGQLGFGNADSLCPPATQFFVATLSKEVVVQGGNPTASLFFNAGPFFLHLYQ